VWNDQNDMTFWAVRTAADGGFRLSVPCDGPYLLIGGQQRGVPTSPLVVDVVRSLPKLVQLQLRPPLVIQGHIEWRDGRPGSNLHVTATAERMESLLPEAFRYVAGKEPLFAFQKVQSDGRGRFVLEAVAPGITYTVACVPDPYGSPAAAEITGVVPGAADLHIELDPERLAGVVLQGEVVADRPARAGRRLLALFHEDRGTWRLVHQRRLAEPTFRISGLRGGDHYVLRVQQPGEPLQALSEPFVARAGMPAVRLELVAKGHVRVRILDSRGLPARVGRVSIEAVAFGTWRGRDPEITTEQPELPMLELAAGRYRFRAVHGPIRTGAVELDVQGGQHHDVVLRFAGSSPR
jgi:hypothetical protein